MLRRAGRGCARCGQLIAADETWDIGRDERDSGRFLGPEHAACGRLAAEETTRTSRVRAEGWWPGHSSRPPTWGLPRRSPPGGGRPPASRYSLAELAIVSTWP